jgi:large subunit ribosomal protein L10
MEKELSQQFKAFPNFIVTNYFGLPANDLNKLRTQMRKASSRYSVIKNRAGRRVLDSLALKDVKAIIDGGIGIGFIGGDVVKASKLIADFSKKHAPLKIRGAYIDGQTLDAKKFNELASLPSREVLLAMVANTMQAPISGFVNVLSGLIRKFVYAINAIKEKKEKKE